MPETEKRSYLPFVAQSSSTREEITKVAQQIKETLRGSGGALSDKVYEAAIETAYILGIFHFIEDAEELLRDVLIHARNNGDVLLEARSYINLAALQIPVHDKAPEDEQVLHNAIGYPDWDGLIVISKII